MVTAYDHDEFSAYLSILNETVAKLIVALTTTNPRNISDLARAVGLSPSLTHYYIKRLINKKFISVVSKLDDAKVGLRPARLFVNANLSLRNQILNALTVIPYWRYITPCVGKYNGFYAQFSIPFGREVEFQSLLDELEDNDLIKDYDLYWVDDVIYVPRGFHWFDFKSKKWIFRWDDWVKEVYENTSYPRIRRRFHNYNSLNLDKYDLFILKELEKNAYVSFNEIAEKLNLTPPAVRYHYYNHVVRYNLLRGFRPVILPYPLKYSDMYIFKISFYDDVCLGKFLSSLKNKPFVSSVTIISRANDAIMDAYLPKNELLNFIESLLKLVDLNVIKDFLYVTLLLKNYVRQTIPYEQFVDGKWQFEYEKYRRTIAEICKKCKKIRVHQYY